MTTPAEPATTTTTPGLTLFVAALDSIERTHAATNRTEPLTGGNLVQSLLDWVDSQCVSLIAWFEHMPEFAALGVEHQASSLGACFAELLVLESVWRSVALGRPEHVALLHPCMSRLELSALGLHEFVVHAGALARTLAEMGLARGEYLCLKALVVFKCEHGLVRSVGLDATRLRCLQALRSQQTATRPLRCDYLLMLLSDLKTLSVRLANVLLALASQPGVQCPQLLSNLLARHASSLK
jgi:hypothetical protein